MANSPKAVRTQVTVEQATVSSCVTYILQVHYSFAHSHPCDEKRSNSLYHNKLVQLSWGNVLFNLFSAYFGGLFGLIISKFFMALGGGWIALSPSTVIYASVLYFLIGTLTLKLLVKIETEQMGMLPDKDSLDTLSWVAVYVALVPVAWVIGTTLYWDGSYYCSAFVVDDGFVFRPEFSEKVGSVTQALIDATEELCLRDPVGYFTAGGLLNTLILYLAWLYSLVVISVILYVAWQQAK